MWDKTGVDKIFGMAVNARAGRNVVVRDCKSVLGICVYFNDRKASMFHDKRCPV